MSNTAWTEFRQTGLGWFINQTLHLFGWTLVFIVDKDTGDTIDCYPKRTSFRGFTEKDSEEGYKAVTGYLKNNIDSISQDVES